MRRVVPFVFFLCLACDSGSSDSGMLGPDGGSAGTSGNGDGDGDGDSGGSGGSGSEVPPEARASQAARAQIDGYVCGSFDACGGDPVGVWEARSMDCNSDILELAFEGLPSCEGVLTAYENGLTGTITFGSTGALALDLQYPGTRELALDAPCLESTQGSADEFACYQNDDSDFEGTHSTACTYEGELCECTTTVSASFAGSGSYTIVDGGTAISDGATSSPFCVMGDTLRFRMTQDDGSFIEVTFQRVVTDECADHSDCAGLSCCVSPQADRTCEEAPVPFPLGNIPPVLCPTGLTPAGLPNGEACADEYHCASGHCVASACSEEPAGPDPLADGEPCAQDAECASASCYLGECVPAGALGAVCVANADCDTAECCMDGFSPALCSGQYGCPGIPAAPCAHDEDCEDSDGSGTCVDEHYCSHQCDADMPECNNTLEECVAGACRLSCFSDEDCEELFGLSYSCVAEEDVYGESVSVCMR